MQRVGIFGASGYAGLELTRLIAGHGKLQLAFAASERHVGASIGEWSGVDGVIGRMTYVSFEAAREAAAKCAVVLLATPAEVSLALAAELVAAGIRVVDLSGAFRLRDASAFTAAYGHAAAPPALQRAAVYGLTELHRERIRGAQLVANPGCYPTAATLPLIPLLRAGLVTTDSIVIDAVSGASGAGRRASEDYSLVEMHDNVRAYKLLAHQHQPEIAQTLAAAASAAIDGRGSPPTEGRSGSIDVTFVPKLLPIPRGILATTTTRLRGTSDAAALTRVLRAAYEHEPFVRVCDRAEDVDLHRVVGTNLCAMAVACEPRAGGRVIVVSAIDNLVKGAAGQALQNLNVMLDLDETTGLAGLRRFF